jgi:hypothetical protein
VPDQVPDPIPPRSALPFILVADSILPLFTILAFWFVTSKFGRGEICYYDFGTQGEDSILTGDGAIDTQNPKGIVALSMS